MNQNKDIGLKKQIKSWPSVENIPLINFWPLLFVPIGFIVLNVVALQTLILLILKLI